MPKRCPHIYNQQTDYQLMTNRQNGFVVKNMQTPRIVVQKLKKHVSNNQFHVLSPTLHINKKDKMLFVPLEFNNYENQGLLDTGAV